jgi:hypothetical protein
MISNRKVGSAFEYAGNLARLRCRAGKLLNPEERRVQQTVLISSTGFRRGMPAGFWAVGERSDTFRRSARTEDELTRAFRVLRRILLRMFISGLWPTTDPQRSQAIVTPITFCRDKEGKVFEIY